MNFILTNEEEEIVKPSKVHIQGDYTFSKTFHVVTAFVNYFVNYSPFFVNNPLFFVNSPLFLVNYSSFCEQFIVFCELFIANYSLLTF